MKLYYDSDDDGIPDTEVTGIISYPEITHVLNKPSLCSVSIRDYEVALFATWEPLDFVKISIEDDSANQLFIGYLTEKKFKAKSMDLTIAGFGIKLSWTPFNNSYELEQGRVHTIIDGPILSCYDDIDGDGDYLGAGAPPGGEDFEWTADQWVSANQDKGIVLETPAGLNSEIWKITAIAFPEATVTAGDNEDTWIYKVDDAEYSGYINDSDPREDTCTFTISESWNGAEDPIHEDKYFQQLEISWNWRFSAGVGSGTYVSCYLEIYNYDTTEWEQIDKIKRHVIGSYVAHDNVGMPKIIINSSVVNIEDYLNDSNADDEYDKLLIRCRFTANASNAFPSIMFDYLDVKIYYHSDNVGAIMLPINSNAVSTITSAGADWDNLGVAEDDGFKIGENTRIILDEIIAESRLDLRMIDPMSVDITRDVIFPTGDGTNSEWDFIDTGHWQDVDTVWDLTYVSTNVSDEVEEFSFATFHLVAKYIYKTTVLIRASRWVGEENEVFVKISWDDGDSWSAAETTGTLTGVMANYTLTFDDLEIRTQDEVDKFQVQLIADTFGAGGEVKVSSIRVAHYTYGSVFNKYDARNFKGSFCIGALNRICKLEHAHWAEDHVNEEIIVVKEADFEDTTIDLNATDYDYDWEFQDKCNSVKEVTVFGNAALRVEATSTEGDPDSLIYKQIIDEGIASYDNALELAKAEAEDYATKKPSIKLTLNGVQSNLNVGEKVHITLEKPDGTDVVAQAFYPIRMIQRSRFGAGIKTTIYAGLGQTEADEKISNAIVKASFMAHDAHQARLISTPVGTGANISWGDVSGGTAAVDAIVATHTADDDAHHTLGYTEAEVDALLGIGVANKRWINLIFEGFSTSGADFSTNVSYRNESGTDLNWNFGITLPLIIGGTHNLVITQTKIGIKDADEGDELDQVRWFGWSDYDTSVVALDSAGGLDEDTPADYTWDHADTTIGGVYERIVLVAGIIATTAKDYEKSYVQVEYYYT